MIGKTFKKLVYGLKTRLHESGKRQVLLAFDHRVDLVRGGDGPPLLFLHSIIGETRWLPFHQQLAESFDVIAPAHPGYGDTEGLDRIDAMEDVVFHYLDVLDGLGLERVNVVGVSLGGWIAAEIAVRYPDRISKLVLADAFGLALEDRPVPDILPSLADPSALKKLLFADPAGPMADVAIQPKIPAQERAQAALRTAELVTRVGAGGSLVDAKLRSRLRRATCPTLVLWGENDSVLPLDHAEAFRDGLPHAELDVVAASGHLPHFEQERKFVSAVREFLGR